MRKCWGVIPLKWNGKEWLASKKGQTYFKHKRSAQAMIKHLKELNMKVRISLVEAEVGAGIRINDVLVIYKKVK